MAPSISLTDAGWNTWGSHSKSARAGHGQLQFIPKTSNSSSRNGVPQSSQVKPLRLNPECGEPTVSIGGFYIAKCRCATKWGQSLSGMGRVLKSRIERGRRTDCVRLCPSEHASQQSVRKSGWLWRAKMIRAESCTHAQRQWFGTSMRPLPAFGHSTTMAKNSRCKRVQECTLVWMVVTAGFRLENSKSVSLLNKEKPILPMMSRTIRGLVTRIGQGMKR